MRAVRLLQLLLLVVAVPAYAQPSAVPLNRAFLGVEDGLSHSRVNAIAQDVEGFLWFGTDDGLSRYDGTSFRVYRHDPADPRSLPHSRVTTLHVEDDGTLWVGTQQGLSRFERRTETFLRYRGTPNRAGNCNGLIVAVTRLPSGRLQAGTNTGYLCELENAPEEGAPVNQGGGRKGGRLRQLLKLPLPGVTCPYSIFDL
ncbi:MAG: two-component regulator propeller domain-containing protein, partial [Bacteroidota bacterium]